MSALLANLKQVEFFSLGFATRISICSDKTELAFYNFTIGGKHGKSTLISPETSSSRGSIAGGISFSRGFEISYPQM